MIIKTLALDDIGYDYDIIDGCNGTHHKLKNGDAAPIIVDDNYSIADGYHRLAGMIASSEAAITVAIIEESDCIDGEDYEDTVDRLSNK